MGERLAGPPSYRQGDHLWQCWVVETGPLPGQSHYEWRNATGRLRVRRASCFRLWLAEADGRVVGDRYQTIGIAMAAAAAVRPSVAESEAA